MLHAMSLLTVHAAGLDNAAGIAVLAHGVAPYRSLSQLVQASFSPSATGRQLIFAGPRGEVARSDLILFGQFALSIPRELFRTIQAILLV